MNERLSSSWVTQRLRHAGVRSQHSLGQHFLIDETTLTAVVESGDVEAADTVIEIGSGLGVLTQVLLQRGAHVIACEVDSVMASVIRNDFFTYIKNGQLELVEGDAMQTLPALMAKAGKYKVVANIPYQITTPLIGLLLEKGPRPVVTSLLVQRELAERLVAPAKTGERSFLSVLCQYFAKAELVTLVPREAFFPAPEVESAVLRLITREDRPLADGEEVLFFRFVKMAFQQRRKQLKNVLAGIRGVPVAEMEKQLKMLKFPGSIRAQELSEDDWLVLYKCQI